MSNCLFYFFKRQFMHFGKKFYKHTARRRKIRLVGNVKGCPTVRLFSAPQKRCIDLLKRRENFIFSFSVTSAGYKWTLTYSVGREKLENKRHPRTSSYRLIWWSFFSLLPTCDWCGILNIHQWIYGPFFFELIKTLLMAWWLW